ncbi:phospholipase D family protein [Planctellipticum variicoloris]|uniref:phospholipase D family protein n=1 Tax=Planctellipticum variicoloris TaxID=3064265 RepID=UPI003013CB26|nr:phospholipase D family protein [Planctomycetaceae bacterium SH412]
MLDYKKDRLDYGERLIPPTGYRLRRAVAATYSLDLNTLLSIPVALFYAQTLEGIESGERVQLLEAIQRCPEVLRVYHQEGKIHVPRIQNRLYGLLEDCVVGVLPKDENSSFHPKVWVLRFEQERGPARYRLIVLSRNLTYDRSWDIAATLDGDVSDDPQERNVPLVDFVRYLLDHQTFDGGELFLNELGRVEFTPPHGFNGNFCFHPIGVGEYRNPVETQKGERLICVSPFVHDAALDRLRRNVVGERWLFGRKEELNRLMPTTFEGFHAYSLSDLVVDGESLSKAEDGEGEPLEQNLHAKLFVFKTGDRANRWFIGSANATMAAFERNVEFLLELRGAGEAVQLERVLDDLLGPDRNAGVFEPFVSPEEAVDAPAEEALERRIRRLEFDLLHVLQITRAELVRSPNGTNYDLMLDFATDGLAWADLEVQVAPFNTDHVPEPLPRSGDIELRFENINESNLSSFLRFEILREKERQQAFLMKIKVAGMPPGRVGTIVRGIVSDPEKFFEYLRFLLAEDFDKDACVGGDAIRESRDGDWNNGAWGVQSPIFEQLLVTVSRRPKRLKEIDDLIAQLLDGDGQDGTEIVPQDFLAFWRAFRDVATQTVGESA